MFPKVVEKYLLCNRIFTKSKILWKSFVNNVEQERFFLNNVIKGIARHSSSHFEHIISNTCCAKHWKNIVCEFSAENVAE